MADSVFLKILQKGKNLILYSFSDNLKTRFFISQSLADQPVELLFRVYYNKEEENGTNRTSYENTYKRQLYTAAFKLGMVTDVLKNDIEKADYKESDVIKIAGDINGISAADLSKNNPSRHRHVYTALAIAGAAAVVIATVYLFATIKTSP